MRKIDNRKKNLIRDKDLKRRKSDLPAKKTEYEKQRTYEEVEQIKKDLRNYAKSSWGKLWIQSNLLVGRPFRMQRGIEYAKDHHRIANLSINPGQIFATVQGTAPTPYRVKINFELIPREGWEKMLKILAKFPLELIELLEGHLPQNFIKIFEENEYSLFPNSQNDMKATCSCPDKAIPCKHIAAVILYIARVLDYNPFLLLELRGKSKNEVFNELRLTASSESKKDFELAVEAEDSEFKYNVPKINIPELTDIQEKTPIDSYHLNFTIKKPGKIIETLENLGNPHNLESKAFGIVLRAIYTKIAARSYEMSLD